jgi:hypothetical protein
MFVFSNQVDLILCNPPRAQIGLATLVDAASGRIVSEPDSGLPYRLRVLSCDAQGLHPGDFTKSNSRQTNKYFELFSCLVDSNLIIEMQTLRKRSLT